jgi:transcriptional activator of cad operon
MERTATTDLRIGDWRVHPASDEISRDGVLTRVDARSMRLLLCLADHAGQVVSIDQLLNQVWPGVTVSQDSVYQSVASLRRLLGDDPRHPAYIATVPRLGYRMVAPVAPWPASPGADPIFNPNQSPALPRITPAIASSRTVTAPRFGFRRRPGLTGRAFPRIAGVTTGLLLLGLAFAYFAQRTPGNITHASPQTVPSQRSIAVLPFLDLTQGMTNGELADGMTEELIDRLSKIPGLRVPSPTSSFFFKDKHVTVAEVAKFLRVAYILDGSIRKSGDRLRVAARLVRVDSGYVVWSETYNRPFHDILTVQDDIAGEVSKALQASIDSTDAKP